MPIKQPFPKSDKLFHTNKKHATPKPVFLHHQTRMGSIVVSPPLHLLLIKSPLVLIADQYGKQTIFS